MADYPSDWDTRRKKVYKRDNFQCQNCGATGGKKGDTELHAHHIVPKSRNGTDNLSNLKALCKACHDAVHYKSKTAPSGGVDSEASDRQANQTSSGHTPSLSPPKESCPLCGENGLQVSNQRIECSRCESVFKSKWYGLKLIQACHRRPFRRICPDCGSVSLNLQHEGTRSPQIVCNTCELTLKYERQYGVWNIASSEEDHSIHLAELDTPSDQKAHVYTPYHSNDEPSNLNDITEIQCPDCSQFALEQQSPRIVSCENCPAKFKAEWGNWKKIGGSSQTKGDSRTVSGWAQTCEEPG